MADIALVFHWSIDALERMAIGELAMWRDKARARVEAQNATGVSA